MASENQQLLPSSVLPAYLQASSCYAQVEQQLVSSLSRAGHHVLYQSAGRSLTFSNNQVIVDEGEAHIEATPREVMELQALHQENLREIRKAKEVLLEQLDEECKLAIRQITEDYDEQKRQEQDRAKAKIEALKKWTESESAAQQQKRSKLEASLRQAHIEEIANYEARRKDAVAKNEAAKTSAEAEFTRFTREMQASSEREIATFKSRQQAALNSGNTARASYLAAAARMKAQVEAARASLQFCQ